MWTDYEIYRLAQARNAELLTQAHRRRLIDELEPARPRGHGWWPVPLRLRRRPDAAPSPSVLPRPAA